jgi:hypothetical protein
MTGQLKGFQGTVSQPGYTFSANLGTGFYLAASGAIGITNVSASTAIIRASGTASFFFGVSVSGAIGVGGSAAFSSNVSVGADLTVVGSVSLANNLYVAGLFAVVGSLSVGSDFHVAGTASLAGNLFVAGSVKGGLTVTGTLTVAQIVGAVVATQGNMESASSLTQLVAPGVQRHHPGHPKAWGLVSADGSLIAGYNVANTTASATGAYLVSLSASMSSSAYAVIALHQAAASGTSGLITFQIVDESTFRIANKTGAGSLFDANFGFTVMGDQ